jgi:hypothetical protein
MLNIIYLALEFTISSKEGVIKVKKNKVKIYNSRDSLVVTYLTTNPLVHYLYIAKRTGSLLLSHATSKMFLNFSLSSNPMNGPLF